MAMRSRGADQETIPLRTSDAPYPRRATLERPLVTSAIAFPLFVAAVHFIIVQVAASLAYRYGTSTSPSGPQRYVPNQLDGLADLLVGPMRRWDGLWYTMIAEQGYGEWSPKAAFWPLFPWTMRGLSRITGLQPEVAGYIIANVCFVLALMFLYRLVALDFDERIARRTLWAIALFPTSLFFSAVYTEAPFLMLSVGALLAARLRYWWIAGILGALAALTRSYGVFLGLPFAVLFLQQHGFYLRHLVPRGLAVAMPALGPALFSLHLDRIWGNPWLWRDVQEQWNRHSAKPWETLRWAFSNSPQAEAIGVPAGADWSWLEQLVRNPSWSLLTDTTWRRGIADSDTLELVCTLLFLGLAVVGLKALPLYQSVWLIPGLLIPLFQPSSVHILMSMPRFGLTLFPLFVVIAWLLRARVIAVPAALVSTALLILLTIQFANWYWVS